MNDLPDLDRVLEVIRPSGSGPASPGACSDAARLPEAPLLLDSPHSGTIYPDDFKPCVSQATLDRVVDAHVDELYSAAPDMGATFIRALFPRSYIDVNRASDDIDPRMIRGFWPGMLRPSEKSRLGHGLIWSICPPGIAMYDCLLEAADVRRRVKGYWMPYHEAIRDEMERLYARFGAVWHINCHSMPETSSPPLAGSIIGGRADMVLGDRDGASCAGWFTAMVRDILTDLGYQVMLNDPYKGAELVRAYSDPPHDRHSLQIEINRAIYMDEATGGKHSGFAKLRQDLTVFVERLSTELRGRLPGYESAAE